MNKKTKSTVLFFTPHADDIELGVPFMYLESLKLENRVIEVLMTDNAYGTKNDEFKGLRLEHIRTKELEIANKVFKKYSNHKIIIHRMEYIDDHLPLNIDSLTKIRDLIYKENPQSSLLQIHGLPKNFMQII